MSWCVSPMVYPVWDSLCFLDLGDYFLSHAREVFHYNLFKIFSDPFFFSSSSGTPIIRMLVCLVLSLRLSSILFILFYLFCSLADISTILSSSSLIRSSASVILLLIPSSVFFISVQMKLSEAVSEVGRRSSFLLITLGVFMLIMNAV